ncbi:MAG: hypothetical protein LBR18_07510 [Tannerella sp.]|nr:hypothetical protein [Tannerella sp.]
MRPSGTEPKIKFYIEVHEQPGSTATNAEVEKMAVEKIARVRTSLGI